MSNKGQLQHYTAGVGHMCRATLSCCIVLSSRCLVHALRVRFEEQTDDFAN